MVTKNWQKNNVIKIINKIERENKIMKTQYKKKVGENFEKEFEYYVY